MFLDSDAGLAGLLDIK